MAKPKQKLGALVDRLWLMREDIRAEEARLNKHKKEFNTLRDRLMEDYDKAEVAKAAGSRGQASLSSRKIYRVADEKLFLDAVRKRKAWHLLKAGLNTDELNVMIEDKPPGNPFAPFPGVALYTDVRLHLTAVKKGNGRRSQSREDDE